MSTRQAALQALTEHARETSLVASLESLLEWDERTMLPAQAGAYRAEQLTWLAGTLHARRTDPRVGEWLAQLAAPTAGDDVADDEATLIRELKREYDKQCKLPRELVQALARATVLGQRTWVSARSDRDFARFRPALEEIVRLKREQAEAYGYDEHLYDALLDDYEPLARTGQVRSVLADLRAELVPLVEAIAAAGRSAPREILQRRFPLAAQEQFSRAAAERIGFDFGRGRLDVTTHPFCSTMGPDDCRITTRYSERWFPGAFFGTLHEAGHGLYEQGLRRDWYGLPPGSAVSLGIHESQSRLWENLVGRSRGFWQGQFPAAREHFPEALAEVAVDDFYFAVNDVQPTLIRVEADEATYNLHIIVRFELEQELLGGELPVAELPQAWNDRYRQYLGIVPEHDGEGVLQDIHWSAGLFGYFPTYALGNLYASQFFTAAEQELGPLEPQFAEGRFGPLRAWLQREIHARGQCESPSQLAGRLSGTTLDHRPLMAHLRGKLGPLYGL